MSEPPLKIAQKFLDCSTSKRPISNKAMRLKRMSSLKLYNLIDFRQLLPIKITPSRLFYAFIWGVEGGNPTW